MGIVNIVNTSTSSGGGGGEIIRELVNSSDGQGLYFSNTGYIHLANNAAVEFGTSDFSIEFVMNQTGEAGTSGGSIYQSATTVNNKFSIENHVSSNVVKLIFFNAVGAASQYDLSYNMAADYNEPTHYVVSCDRSGNAVLYRNGTEVASVSIAASASTNLGDGVTSTAMIGNSGSGYTFLGGLYRFRTWNKALSHDEVDTCFQRADVPFESQYGSETNLVSGYNFTSGYAAYGSGAIVDANTYTTGGAGSGIQKSLLTVGKKYRITVAGASSSGDFQLQAYGTWTVLATGFGTHEFTATTTAIALTATASSTVDITTFSLTAIGVLTDHDLAFANPTQSAMCQDRAGNSDGTMGGTIQQTQKIVQLNATSISVSNATARTPADGEIVADEFSIAEFKTSTNVLETNVAGQTGARLRAAVSDVGTPTFSFNDDTDTGMYRAAANSLGFTTAGVARMSISSAGDVSVNATTPKAKLHVKATGTNWEDSLLLEKKQWQYWLEFFAGKFRKQ